MERHLKEMFDLHATWQRGRAKISWAEKLRLSKIMRETQLALRAGFRKYESQGKSSVRSSPG